MISPAQADDLALVICRKYQAFVARMAQVSSANVHDAHDAAQSVFLDLIDAIRRGVLTDDDAEIRRRVIWRCIDHRRGEARYRLLNETGHDLDRLVARVPWIPGDPRVQRRQLRTFIGRWLAGMDARIVLQLVWPSEKLRALARRAHRGNGNGRIRQQDVGAFLGVSRCRVSRALRTARRTIPQEV